MKYTSEEYTSVNTQVKYRNTSESTVKYTGNTQYRNTQVKVYTSVKYTSESEIQKYTSEIHK